MNRSKSGTTRWIGCRVVFGASRDGRRTESIEIAGSMATFDHDKDLGEQAGAAVAGWLSRQRRIHGHRYHDAVITLIEVHTDDGRYFDATQRGWGVLDETVVA